MQLISNKIQFQQSGLKFHRLKSQIWFKYQFSNHMWYAINFWRASSWQNLISAWGKRLREKKRSESAKVSWVGQRSNFALLGQKENWRALCVCHFSVVPKQRTRGAQFSTASVENFLRSDRTWLYIKLSRPTRISSENRVRMLHRARKHTRPTVIFKHCVRGNQKHFLFCSSGRDYLTNKLPSRARTFPK
jgi:hypothetical protein